MVQAGLSDDIIITKLRKDGKSYDLTPEQMVRLKRANVSDAVMKTLLDPTIQVKETPSAASPSSPRPPVVPLPVLVGAVPNRSGATPAPGAAAPGDPNDPMASHDSGIYLYMKDPDGKAQMILLERAAYQGSKTGGIFGAAMTGGLIKAKIKAIIPGPRASIRASEPAPTFYFYFDDKAAGLGKGIFGNSVSNPNQFALVKLDTTKSNRETIIMQIGAFGSSSGTDTKAMAAFKSDRVRPGLYKVVPTAPLEPGEYCFFASLGSFGAMGAGTAGAVDIFDFGVDRF